MRYGILELTAVVDGEGIPEAAQKDFTTLAQAVGPTFGKLAEITGIDQLSVECILAAKFAQAVEARMRRFGDGDQEAFTVERVGGLVAAKNLPQAEDDSKIAIVFDAGMWAGIGNLALAHKAAIMAHEAAHPVMARVRRLSGALEGVIFPSQTLTEIARSSARIDWDEFRAENIADLVLQAMATMGDHGPAARPLPLAEISMAGYIEQAKMQLAAAYPAWAERVQAYREWKLTLGDIWVPTLRDLTQMRTLMAMMLGCAGSESNDPVDSAVSALPAYSLYFGAPWEAYIAAMRRLPILTKVSDHHEVEREILEIGEASVRHSLKALGLTADDLPDRQCYVHVTEPQRI